MPVRMGRVGEDPPRGHSPRGPRVDVVRGPMATRRLPLSVTGARRLAEFVLAREGVRHGLVQVHFVGRRAMARVHAQQTGVGGITDVVTLEHVREAPGAPVVGEIWIAPEVAADQARTWGVSARAEVQRLVIHGILHTLGWVHPDGVQRERSAMWKRQEAHLRAALRAGIA